MSRKEFERTLTIMYHEGWSIRSLSRYFGASRQRGQKDPEGSREA